MKVAKYSDTRLTDCAHLIQLLWEHCDKIGMNQDAHRKMAERYHPDRSKVSSIKSRRDGRNVDADFDTTCVMWCKVFGWSLVLVIDEREYVVSDITDVQQMTREYLERHEMSMSHLRRVTLKDKSGSAFLQSYTSQVRHVRFTTLIKALEGMGGQLVLRRPKKR